MSFNIGENIGAYRITEQLGQGGMATVYKAYHAALDRYVALKVLHPAFKEDETFTARFQREARVVAKLEHPNIVPIYDYSEHEGRPYLVMKYIEGDTLKARLSKGPLTSAEITKVVDCVGAALAYAHKQGILHRDIKPSNVLIAVNGEMYLADFGLARIAQAGESTLSSDAIMGTPQYISPEQALGKKDLDNGTDIYSFGVMLYELVVGQVPFSADTPFSIIHDHIYTPLPLPMRVNPNVPEPVQRVLLKALAKNRADRYETVNELMTAFKNAWQEAGVPMQGTDITMPPVSLKQVAETEKNAGPAAPAVETGAANTSAKKKRSPWRWIASGAILLCACLFIFATFRSRLFSLRPQPAIPSQPPATQLTVIHTAPPTLPNPATPALLPSTDIAAAQELVLKKPNDPKAHFQLAIAFWDAGQTRRALEELAKADKLAGPTDRALFLEAASQFKSRQAWVAAASMYQRALLTYPSGNMPKDVLVDFSEAVYKSAEQADMPLFLFFEKIDRVSEPLGLVARGRHSLFSGDIEDAQTQMDNALKLKPNFPEALLLNSEIAMKTNHPEIAKPILLTLSTDVRVSDWIRVMAGGILKTVP